MELKDQQTIDNYIQTISELAMPIDVVINNGVATGGCRLICEAGGGKELFIQITLGDYPEAGDVQLTWTYSRALYTFKSKIISRRALDSNSMLLEIEFPDSITKEERRKYLRVRPSEEHPIEIRFALPDSDIVKVEAMDISGGGVSFIMSNYVNHFKVGDSLYLDISLPIHGNIYALADVKSITHLQDMTRIGVEFSSLSEDAFRIVTQYVTAQEQHIRAGADKE
jgi:c-di-GMP-binding flagellar brake protein YcgR